MSSLPLLCKFSLRFRANFCHTKHVSAWHSCGFMCLLALFYTEDRQSHWNQTELWVCFACWVQEGSLSEHSISTFLSRTGPCIHLLYKGMLFSSPLCRWGWPWASDLSIFSLPMPCVICVVGNTEHGASCRLPHHLTNWALVSTVDEWFHFIWCAFQILKRAHLFLSLFGESFPFSNLPILISWPVMGQTGQEPNLDQI